MDDLWQQAVVDLTEGNFSALQAALGGPDGFDTQIVEWFENGHFANEPEIMAEALTCACMLGRLDTARYLLDHGVDPLAGTKTGLNGFHYAASSGRLNIIQVLIEHDVPMEVENMYGATVLGQALWSAIHEHKPEHADVIAALIDAGANVSPGTLEWWNSRNVPSASTKERVAASLSGAE